MSAELSYQLCAAEDLSAMLDALLVGEAWDAWLEDPLLERDPRGLVLRDTLSRSEGLALPMLWPEGRLFNQALDLRWERRSNGTTHLVVIADADALPAPFRTPALVPLTLVVRPGDDGSPQHLLLWGERTGEGDWREGRIPDISRFYPAWKGPWAAIAARTYEALWVYDPAMPPTVRTVTRYLGYVGNYKAPGDKRFT